jgi:hypothetical protein
VVWQSLYTSSLQGMAQGVVQAWLKANWMLPYRRTERAVWPVNKILSAAVSNQKKKISRTNQSSEADHQSFLDLGA